MKYYNTTKHMFLGGKSSIPYYLSGLTVKLLSKERQEEINP